MTRPRWHSAIAFAALLVFWIAAVRAFLLIGREDPLWLDELHTQWLVSASWSEVFSRSLRWNQTPLYFLVEYVAVHFLPEIGGRERLLSIVSVAATGIFLAIFVGRRTGNWLAAAFTSIAFGFVSQVPFYATEARPYALLMLATVLQVAWLLDFLGGRGTQEVPAADRSKPTKFGVVVGLMLGCVLVAIHPTAMLILIAEFIVLAIWRFSIWNSRVERVHIGKGLVIIALAAMSGVAWLASLERTFLQRHLWNSIAEPGQLAVWFVWLAIWTTVPMVFGFMIPRTKNEIQPPTKRFFNQTWLTIGISMVVVGSMLGLDAAQIFPVANIRYAVGILPVMFVSMGLFLGRLPLAAIAVCGTLVLFGLTVLPSPRWDSNRLTWTAERNWMVDALSGKVSQLRFEQWQEVDSILGNEIAGTRAVVFLLANVLEDCNLADGSSSSRQTPLGDFLFPVAGFRSQRLNVDFLSCSTLLGPRFSKADLARLVNPDEKHFVVIRGTDATVRAVQNEIKTAFKSNNREIEFSFLGPANSNVHVWQINLR